MHVRVGVAVLLAHTACQVSANLLPATRVPASCEAAAACTSWWQDSTHLLLLSQLAAKLGCCHSVVLRCLCICIVHAPCLTYEATGSVHSCVGTRTQLDTMRLGIIRVGSPLSVAHCGSHCMCWLLGYME
jgi:hypothetical protein